MDRGRSMSIMELMAEDPSFPEQHGYKQNNNNNKKQVRVSS